MQRILKKQMKITKQHLPSCSIFPGLQSSDLFKSFFSASIHERKLACVQEIDPNSKSFFVAFKTSMSSFLIADHSIELYLKTTII